MKVKDILDNKRRRILQVGKTDAISSAVSIMVENDTGSVAVYDGPEKFVGMLTFREVLIAVEKRVLAKAPNAPAVNFWRRIKTPMQRRMTGLTKFAI